MAEPLTVSRSGDVAIVTLGRPERRNALSQALLAALCSTIPTVEATASAMVLTGEGDTFCAGADLQELEGSVADLEVDEKIGKVVAALRETSIPVVAAVEGACVGAGVELAMACDIRIAGDGAFFALPAAQMGILYNPEALQRFHRLLRRDALARLLLFAERVPAEEALQLGLVSRVVPAGEALSAALELADQATRSKREALAAAKALLRACDDDRVEGVVWEAWRRALLASPWRVEALKRARGEA